MDRIKYTTQPLSQQRRGFVLRLIEEDDIAAAIGALLSIYNQDEMLRLVIEIRGIIGPEKMFFIDQALLAFFSMRLSE